MKLEFLGTRGYIDARTQAHGRHSVLKVGYLGRSVAIDCGEDWLGIVKEWDVGAIVVTHAHPDHAWGLKDGAPCPVYATGEAWEEMDEYAIEERRVLAAREPAEVEGILFEAFPVEHSTRAPAVGYRITAGEVAIFYVPDVVWIRDRKEALAGVQLYVGDGATVTQSMVRKIEGTLIGHTPLRTQLTWCQKEGVPRAVFSHCGAEIVEGDERTLGAEIRGMAEKRGVEVEIAYDGMELVLR
jgi:phosphoribosyl 1,2-cyclic phosphodiesterase